ncbi:hypothetical protein E8K88_14305 [Lampropedia aestuarii]|uniref:HTH luxR-type domain-containing protein n=1 Tax=Lampropedia aestuarii TaxID=2562762 RepID=A0A4S5BLL5_9BURK|nr:LuxR C-terminal-related transcriptional regulator [Lampropedia aestuarii]THJ31651.1 hypothetical protein E8K88_14305 [Lampropedia aestuarii]
MASSKDPHHGPRLKQGLLERVQILERWLAQRDKTLHLLLGPAGSGKTTLALQWRRQLFAHGFDTAWISVHAEDEMHALVEKLFNALESISPVISQKPHGHDLRQGRFLDVSAIAISLIHSIQRYSRQVVLVFDDFHNANAHQAKLLLQTLLDYAPANLHVLIVSRSTPALLFERLRAAQQTYEQDEQQLRFSATEVQQLVHLWPGLQTIAWPRLVHMSDGWITGLQLLAAHAKKHGHALDGHQTFIKPEITAYFNQEVLYCLSPESLRGLVRLSPTRQFNASLAVSMLGVETGKNLLMQLQAQRLFISPVESGDSGACAWWRFHPLFRELLLARFAQMPDELQCNTHMRLGQWFEQHGMLRDTVQHYAAAGEIDTAIACIEASAQALFFNGHLQALVQAVAAIPAAHLQHRNGLLLWLAWSQLCYRQFDACNASIAQLDWLLATGIDDAFAGSADGALQAHVCLLKFSLALQSDDLDLAHALLPQMLELQQPHQAVLQGGRGNLLAWFFSRQGLHEQARHYLKGAGYYRSDGVLLLDSPFGSLMSQALEGMSYLHEGNYRHAEDVLRAVLAQAEAGPGSHCEAACNAAGWLCEVLYEINHIADLRNLLERYGNAIAKVACPDAQLSSTLARSRLLALEGHFAESHAVLDGFMDVARSRNMLYLVAVLVHEQLELQLRQASPSQSPVYLATLDQLAQQALQTRHHGAQPIAQYAALAHALWRVHSLNEQSDPALLLGLESNPLVTGRLRLRTAALVAIAHQRAGLETIAEQIVLQVLLQAHTCGCVNTVLDMGQDLRQLVQQVQARSLDTNPLLGFYVDGLLQHARQRQSAVAQPAQKPGAKAESLSERELQILRLLANDLPNKRIANALGVSAETVKWHLRNIYKKLSVFSRSEAVVAARRLQLVTESI